MKETPPPAPKVILVAKVNNHYRIMIHSNHIRSNKQYWHDTNQCCQQRQCLRDVLLASWGRFFRFREINPRTKADWIKGFGRLLLLHHYWRRRWEWVQLSTINASPLLKATRRIWTSTLWHRKKWKRRRKYPRNSVQDVWRVFCPLVKCDGQCASASARGSQGLWRWQEQQQQQLEPKQWPKARAQQGPASTVRIIFLLDEATVSFGHDKLGL